MRVNAVNPGHFVTDRLRRRVETYSLEKGMTTEEAQEALCVEHGIWRLRQRGRGGPGYSIYVLASWRLHQWCDGRRRWRSLSWHLNGAASAMSAPPTVALVASELPSSALSAKKGDGMA